MADDIAGMNGRPVISDPLQDKPQEQILPVAADTWQGTPAIAKNPNFDDLASALAGFAGDINKYSIVNARLEKKEQAGRVPEFAALPQSTQIAIGRGHVDQATGKSGINAAFDAGTYGVAEADNLDQTIRTSIESGNGPQQPGADSFDKWAVDQAAPIRDQIYQKYGEGPALSAFDRKFNAMRNEYRKMGQGSQVMQNEQDARDSTFNGIKSVYGDSVKANQPPEQRVNAINNLLGELKAKVGRNPKAMDDIAFNFADSIVATDPETAVRLIMQPRTGTDGSTVPAIGLKYDNLQRTDALIAKAQKAGLQQWTNQIKSAQTQADLSDVLAGKLSVPSIETQKYPSPDGTQITISKEDRIKALEDAYQTHSAQVAKNRQETPDKTMDREINDMASSGLIPSHWKQHFAASPASVTDANLSDPSVSSQLIHDGHVYQAMKAASPLLPARVMNKDTMRFYDLYGVAKQEGMDDLAALQAARTASDPASDSKSAVMRSPEIVQQIHSAAEFAARGGNSSEYEATIREHATLLANMGLDPKIAVKHATDWASSNGSMVNGWWVPTPTGPDGKAAYQPADFGNLATGVLQKWYDAHADQNEVRPSDLTLRQNPNGGYQVVNKGTGFPVIPKTPDPKNPLGIISLKDIEAAAGKPRADELNAIKDSSGKDASAISKILGGTARAFFPTYTERGGKRTLMLFRTPVQASQLHAPPPQQ